MMETMRLWNILFFGVALILIYLTVRLASPQPMNPLEVVIVTPAWNATQIAHATEVARTPRPSLERFIQEGR